MSLDRPDRAGEAVADDADDPGDADAGVVAPSREDAVVRAASQVVGGPAGSRLASSRPWAAVPLLVLLSVAVLAAAVVEKQHCRAQGWTTPDQFWHACYSDIPVLYGSAGLGEAVRPGLREATGPGGIGQPPLASAAMWVVSAFVPGDRADAPRIFFDLSTILVAAMLALAVAALALAAGRRRWDAAHLAASPVVVLSALISYQVLAVTLLCLALLAWSRDRPVVAGVLLGLGAAAAPHLALAGVAALLGGLPGGRQAGRQGGRARGRAGSGRDGVAAAGAGLATWLAVRLLLLGLDGLDPRVLWNAWRTSDPGYGSIWLVPQLLEGIRAGSGRWWSGVFRAAHPVTGTAATVLAAAVLALLVGSLAYRLARLRSPGRHTVVAASPDPGVSLARTSLVLVAGALLVSTSLPVQTSLLLLPLLALSRLPWRDHLVWAAAEAVYFVGVWLYIAGQSQADRGLPGGFYLILLLVRLAGIGWLAIRADMALQADSRQAPHRLWTDFEAVAPPRYP